MFVVGEAIIEDAVANERFACDVLKCKGACCALPGGRGAPIEDDELPELHRAFRAAKKYLSQHHLEAIERVGIYEGNEGNFTTTCIDEKECVFVYYEDGIARCSIEKAYNSGELSWRKPISCHLFPIRVSRNSGEHLRYEKITECRPGVIQGQFGNFLMVDFLKDALVRKYGQLWYDEFRKECLRQQYQKDRSAFSLKSLRSK